MKKFLSILISVLLYTGCSTKIINNKKSCSDKNTPSKSLQFLEQEYNCSFNN